GLLMLWRSKQVAAFLNRCMFPEHQPADSQKPSRILFALSLLVPWMVLLMVVEAGRPERYWWLWPFQTAAVVAAATYFADQLRLPRAAIVIGQICLAIVMLANPWVVAPIQAWARDGWSGHTTDDFEAIEFVGNQLRSEGKERAAVGYQIYFYGFEPNFHAVDAAYKVGAAYDMILKYKHGITNADQCAEGASSTDDYRIVQTQSLPPQSDDYFDQNPQNIFDVPLDENFHLLRQFGDFQVFARALKTSAK